MKQEDKDILLKDLCARLPYSVKVESIFINSDTKEHKSCGIEVFDATDILMIRDGFGEFKPYLFPLSSMTEEQKMFLTQQNWCIAISTSGTVETTIEGFDWLNKNHLDYRCLIEKGLAIDATGLNIY